MDNLGALEIVSKYLLSYTIFLKVKLLEMIISFFFLKAQFDLFDLGELWTFKTLTQYSIGSKFHKLFYHFERLKLILVTFFKTICLKIIKFGNILHKM